MPGPGVYVLAVVGTVAVGYAFYEFVYEPHIAPKLEQWAEDFVARRKARRLQKQGLVAVPQNPGSSSASKKAHNSSDDESDDDDAWNSKTSGRRSSIELENLVAKELREWRSEAGGSNLRHRKNTSTSASSKVSSFNTLDESNASIPYSPITPTHVIFDPSDPPTPTSTIGSSAGLSSAFTHKRSQSTLRTSSPVANSSSGPNSHRSASPEIRSFGPGPWVAQQIDLAKRFETASSSADANGAGDLSRSSTPFSHVSYSSAQPRLNEVTGAASAIYQPSPMILSPINSPMLSLGAPASIQLPPSSGDSIIPSPISSLPGSPSASSASSQPYLTGSQANNSPQTIASPPMPPPQLQQINISISSPTSPVPNSPEPNSPGLAFSPVVQSLSFTAHNAEESDDGDIVSRPTSSMSFLSDAQMTFSAPSEISFTQSLDNSSSFDEDDVVSIGSGSASPGSDWGRI